MPLFAIICHDRPDAGTLRADTRPRHLEHLQRIGEAMAMAGPMLDESGVPRGSIVIADFADLESARAFAAADPYAEAGLFADVTVTGYRQVLP
ncbi:YciI family protein [Sphingomonas abietis]|uniref:YciI family protein n=1 Tax=Sphingomonas abietis TaxID=3012344 RepID=A0ABY7NLL0_9SPHN|nr:YciI family protein [Sphingomonas abietis]WBO22403.1 YciI family protein [Sphingomonas abietis]